MIVQVILFVAFIALLYNYFRKPDGLPPGDWGWPIIGRLPGRGQVFKNYISRMREKHGDIFCFKSGSITNVFVCDFETIKDALSKPDFAVKPNFYGSGYLVHSKNLGLIRANGPEWTNNRRFTIHHLKNFGLGTSRMEAIIIRELEELIKYLDTKLDVAIELDTLINVVVTNVVWNLVADRRYDVEDSEIQRYCDLFDTFLRIINGPLALLDVFPWLQICLPQIVRNNWMKDHKLAELRDNVEIFIKEIIKEHQDELDPKNPRDYIDAYLIEIQKGNCETFTAQNLVCSMIDLFLAGSETTASYLRWFVIYMANYQDIQERLHQDISSVIAKDNLPSLDDKASLPYMEAVNHEIHRLISFVPFNTPHFALKDTVINGFKIPKGMLLHTCFEMCHRSSKHWKKPDEFYPEHFIDEDGKFFIPKTGFLPFSIGKRICLGESLAKMEIFIFTTAILQRYKICPPDGVTMSFKASDDANIVSFAPHTRIVLKKRA